MKRILILALLFISFDSFAQKKPGPGIRKGMLRAEGSLCYGSGANNRYYLQGELEYLVHNRVGLNGMTYFNIGPAGIYPKSVHSVFSGPAFHFPMSKQLDLSLAIQPGFSFVKDNGSIENSAVSEMVPNTSLMGGLAYYGSFFHVFFQMRANAAYTNDTVERQNLSDLRISFGLGWNLNLK
ncbi:MAG: hypothetical protein WCI97_08375 [Bacteroidota bacterium]